MELFSKDDELYIFEEYSRDKDLRIRDIIFNKYLPLAYKFSKGNDDFLQEGFIQLLKAIETYDLLKNVSFKNYASLTIKNGIRDYQYSKSVKSGKLSKRKVFEYIQLNILKKNEEINFIPNKKEMLSEKQLTELNKLKSFIQPIELDFSFTNNDDSNHNTISKKNTDVERRLLEIDIENLLTNEENKIFSLLLEDKSVGIISNILNLNQEQIYYKIKKLRNKIIKYLDE